MNGVSLIPAHRGFSAILLPDKLGNYGKPWMQRTDSDAFASIHSVICMSDYTFPQQCPLCADTCFAHGLPLYRMYDIKHLMKCTSLCTV